MEKFDVAVVGLGALGSAAVWQVARKGAKVVGFEQFEFGHVRGASHDTSRIVRTAYDAPEYVSLAKAAYKDWAELEKDAGLKLLTVTGGIVVLANDRTWTSGFKVSDYTASLDANNVPYELLSAKEVNKRWPKLDIDDDENAVYTPDTGIAHAAKSVTAMQFVARARGAILKENTPVTAIIPITNGRNDKGVIIKTENGDFQARKVILAADAWTNKLLAPLGAQIPLEVMQEQVTYFKPKEPALFDAEHFPVWIRMVDGKTFYGFPTFGEPTIKAGRDVSNNRMSPEERSYTHSPKLLDELTAFMKDFVTKDEDLEILRTVTCQYTITPGRHFVLSALNQYPDILVALGAAHGFKFAPVIGRVMAELAIDGKTTEDLSKFVIPAIQSVVRSKI
ncbi:related to monomeric sarcosine oxidase [Fusarium fujikuroi IMI 58289]|uniref:sarcosine oxidasee (formaldehyde-forming) n=1 Tax=Gibberella fujikuroi (strain CBS 195.34 / IMI 58289 / NRRL A-6831) TaxID=1279085 RepID=S0DZF2_GIBF5|nr:related to monomeric sarcosine oxidase [Fusarium fujikuroi IMI 58289]KLO95417.1 monomeric sarcosine oxidase [Fusarium fujikuroi]CCT67959.1 related to monomeric sarcosine oxidase [Fusarium fujikuroi IMI 58289]SCN94138.1 related to monomeric sarcosine oxidase [Fusarium fujikuroi]SCO47028.1 related to monomeric sarcosine oxidase [Fusarium fujikuroi]SCV28335.1 related to monomeric sarcosine oxidase [Fusarium fujikuroi]